MARTHGHIDSRSVSYKSPHSRKFRKRKDQLSHAIYRKKVREQFSVRFEDDENFYLDMDDTSLPEIHLDKRR